MDLPEPVSRRHAIEAGFTDYELHRASWRRVRHGHYVPDAAAFDSLTAQQRHLVATRAAALAASAESVVSHVSAAIAHGLPLWAVPTNRVHLTRDRRSGARSGRHVVLHAAPFAEDDVVTVAGLRTTSVARTVEDLARSISFEQAVVLGDAALHLGKVTAAELDVQLARATRRPGCAAARRAVAFLDDRAESPGESRSRVRMRTQFPAPQLQPDLLDECGRFVARVDFLFPDLGVVGEFDGLVKYGRPSSVARQDTDRPARDVVIAEKIREDAMRALGWIVVRWTWAELDSQRWLDRLMTSVEIGRRSPRLGSWRPARR